MGPPVERLVVSSRMAEIYPPDASLDTAISHDLANQRFRTDIVTYAYDRKHDDSKPFDKTLAPFIEVIFDGRNYGCECRKADKGAYVIA